MWKGLQFPGLRTQLLVVSRPQTGPAITGRTATQSLTKELSPVRCGFKPTLHVCSKKLNWNRLKSNPLPPCLALSPLCRKCWGLQERQGQQLFHNDKNPHGCRDLLNKCSLSGLLLLSSLSQHWQSEWALYPLQAWSLKDPTALKRTPSAVHWAFTAHWMKGREEKCYKGKGAGVSVLMYLNYTTLIIRGTSQNLASSPIHIPFIRGANRSIKIP